MQHTESTFQGAGGSLLYCQAWRPNGPATAVIVGVHGLGDHSGGLRNIIGHVLPRGYAWYGLDLRGHGRSPGPRGHVGSWSDFLDDLHAFLLWVRGRAAGVPVFLLGHSLGGLICLDYAMQHPEGLDGVIAISRPFALPGSLRQRSCCCAPSPSSNPTWPSRKRRITGS
jgi:alpha-beta hydrolase superfamily lysophospholipase